VQQAGQHLKMSEELNADSPKQPQKAAETPKTDTSTSISDEKPRSATGLKSTQNRPPITVMLLTFLLGGGGGAAFAALGLPAAWLSGAAVIVSAAALAGVPLHVPRIVRECAWIVLGITMGSAVTPETLALIGRWPASLVVLGLSFSAVMAGISFYLQRVHGFDTATARLAAVPGNSAMVLALAQDSQCDVSRVVFLQTARLACLVMLLPAVFRLLGLVPDTVTVDLPRPVDLQHVMIVLGTGSLGAILFLQARVPGGSIFGAMLGSLIPFASGMVTTALPNWLLIIGFTTIGTVFGVTLAGIDRRLFTSCLWASLGSLVVGAALTTACAIPASLVLGLPIGQLWLAYAPGGVDVMSVMAFVMGLDPAFVGAHHVARTLCLSLVTPLWLRPFKKPHLKA
jgi:membrane AbrB-like protein